MCAPFVADVLYHSDEGGDGGELVDEVIQPILESLKVSRRDVERLRQVLLVQRKIGPSKRRRGRPAALARREFFGDALLLFELVQGESDPGVSDELQRWRALMGGPASGEGASGVAPSGEREPGAPAGDGPPRRRRRRRGGRGRNPSA